MEPQGRSALVTGGAGGLGGATVRRLVESGCGVAVFDRDGERAEVLAKELGDLAVAVTGDVNDDGDVGSAIDAATALGPLSVGTPLMMSTPEELQAHLVSTIQFPKRMGKPEELALLVEQIVCNPYLNGESIRLDGALRFPPK